MKIHLGCGRSYLEGFVNIDVYPVPPEHGLTTDLDSAELNLPFNSDSVEEIKAIDFLEHVKNLIPLMNECHRILASNGVFYIEVPRVPSDAAFSDPTHVRFFTEETFRYFTDYALIFPMYGIRKWKEVLKKVEDNRIFITLSPVK